MERFDGREVVEVAKKELSRVERYAAKLRRTIAEFAGEAPEPKKPVKRDKVDWDKIVPVIKADIESRVKAVTAIQIAKSTGIPEGRVYRAIRILIDRNEVRRGNTKKGRADTFVAVKAEVGPKSEPDKPNQSKKYTKPASPPIKHKKYAKPASASIKQSQAKSKPTGKKRGPYRKRSESERLVRDAMRRLGNRTTVNDIQSNISTVDREEISSQQVQQTINGLIEKREVNTVGRTPRNGRAPGRIIYERKTTPVHAGEGVKQQGQKMRIRPSYLD